MRPIASAVSIPLLKHNLARKFAEDKPPFSIGPLHSLFLCNLYLMGIQGRNRAHIPIKEEEIKDLEKVFTPLNQIASAETQKLLGNVLTELRGSAKDSHEEEKAIKQDTKEESLSQPQKIEKESQKNCRICKKPCLPEDESPFGFACHFGSNNYISQAQLFQISKARAKVDHSSYSKEEWRQALKKGQFFLKPTSFLVHYHCIKQQLSKLDPREYAVGKAFFNCVIPLKSAYSEPSFEQLKELKDPTQLYNQPHQSLQFIATILENYDSLHQDSLPAKIQKMLAMPTVVKANIHRLPMIVAEVVSDNVALVVRLRGLKAFLKECETSFSPTLACVQNLHKVFQLFEINLSDYLDEAISQTTPGGFLSYGHKIERHFGNLVIWRKEMDEEAIQRIKVLFSLYSQLIVEIKIHEDRPPEISRSDLLPLVQMASALIISKYKVSNIPEVRKKLEELDAIHCFDYLWEEILGMNPLVLGVLTTRAVTSSQANPFLNNREDYLERKPLRALLLTSHPLKLKLFSLPSDFTAFQTLYYDKKCSRCNSSSKVALVCGFCEEVICCNSLCCGVENCDEKLLHSFTCGYGTGVFIQAKNSCVTVIVGASRTNKHVLIGPYRNGIGECADERKPHCQLNIKVLEAIENKLTHLQNNFS